MSRRYASRFISARLRCWHSYGGALAQAYALKYQKNLTHLILASTWSSTKELNQVFMRMKEKMRGVARSHQSHGGGGAVRARSRLSEEPI